MESSDVFIRLDADHIGEKIELSLYIEDFKLANEIHNKVQLGISNIREKLSQVVTCKILMVGSDDILFSINKNSYNKIVLDEIAKIFYNTSNFTLSFGVGTSVIQAMHNLNLAKLSGRNKIISFDELTDIKE